MAMTETEFIHFIREAKAYIKMIERRAKANFEHALVEQVRKRSGSWKMLLRGQEPTCRKDIVEVIAGEEWVRSVDESTAEDAISFLSVALFVSPYDSWVAETERDELSRLGVSGYSDASESERVREGKGCIAKIVKKAASEGWKKTINTAALKNLGWYVGVRDESKANPTFRYQVIAMKSGHKAYKVTANGSETMLDRVKVAIKDYAKQGGSMEEVERFVEEVKRDEAVTRGDAAVGIALLMRGQGEEGNHIQLE